uniref:Mitochondrial inner membrane protease ATP23 n=1 Tax=Chromera velia CCMP2878 TaxID=1169474 RepID=A0A0G4FHY3_9ALVE|mmetsp:Transcript_52795/g.103237  ORF Transcript_52795/g.103237 Transcript_52795/m.103237 type:complete len:144 (+) Transcript_52795:194-625(+)|eukprot:Cvel_17039.t1-p1 / transcript=Cvel_17039.t1 / gene=Cvel_17039 / organism=Chromera_velia_CCMP2878 / gene_product=hypothetical protein / transcript_product=hypothetical protein / location=Cvel_scaffold1341:5080-6919(-) / protein_length=143 / sequence_SO=supercontig / SO=protein_coding / is_pseudo=false
MQRGWDPLAKLKDSLPSFLSSGSVETPEKDLPCPVQSDDGLSEEERRECRFLIRKGSDHRKTREMIEALQRMAERGKGTREGFSFMCRQCTPETVTPTGYYPTINTVWFCANRKWGRSSFNSALRHQVLHAFDSVRAKADRRA